MSPVASNSLLRNSAASESTRSIASSSEYEKKSAISDVSSEYTMEPLTESKPKALYEDKKTELQELPKDIQEMVQRAMCLDQ